MTARVLMFEVNLYPIKINECFAGYNPHSDSQATIKLHYLRKPQ